MKYKTSDLKKWDLNPKNQSKEQYADMVEKYKRFGQLTEFLVMPDNTILGGNHGMDALNELSIEEADGRPVDFVQEGEEWFFINDGQIKRQESFKSKLEGMIKVSIIHNARFSQYGQDDLANLVGNNDVDIGDYPIDFYQPAALNKLLNEDFTQDKVDEENKERIKKMRNVECPHCHEKFTI